MRFWDLRTGGSRLALASRSVPTDVHKLLLKEVRERTGESGLERSELKKRLRSASSRFQLDGKVVRLVAKKRNA